MAPKLASNAPEWTVRTATRLEQFHDILRDEAGYPTPVPEPAAGETVQPPLRPWAAVDVWGVLPMRHIPDTPLEEQRAQRLGLGTWFCPPTASDFVNHMGN